MPKVRPRSARPSRGAVAGALFALSFAIYLPALSAELVSDDRLAISGNEFVTGPLRPLAIFTTFSWWGSARPDAPGYRPAVTLSFALDRVLTNLDPAWLHALNIALHALVSWLVFALGLRITLTRRQALLAAVAFAVLPIHSEAVIWPVGRAELMAAAGFVGTVVCLLEYRTRGGPRHLIVATALFLVALFSKENAVTLLVAPALAALCLPRLPAALRRDVIATLSLAATLGCYLAVRAIAGEVLGSTAGDRLDNPLSVLATGERLLAAASVLGRYMLLTVWPHPLSVDYSYDALGIDRGFRGDLCGALALGVTIVILALAWRRRSDHPGALFGVLLAAASYSIVANVVLVIGTAMAERLFYLPTVGLCLAAAPPLDSVFSKARGRGKWALIAVAAAYAAVTFTRALEWRSPVTLFEAAVRAYPRSARAQMELGSAYGHAGRVEDALHAFDRATAIMPDYAAAWYNLGNLHARRGSYERAVSAYRTALEHAPRLTPARYNLALALLPLGRTDEALDSLRVAASASPNDAALSMTMGDVYLGAGRNAEAIVAYSKVIEIEPRASAALLNRGVAIERSSGCEAALTDYTAVLDLQPGSATALRNAVACLRALGRNEEAQRLLARGPVANQGFGR